MAASVSGGVLRRKVARIIRLFGELRFAERAMSAIAYGAGFGDVSHFNRAPRRRYGESPSKVPVAAA